MNFKNNEIKRNPHFTAAINKVAETMGYTHRYVRLAVDGKVSSLVGPTLVSLTKVLIKAYEQACTKAEEEILTPEFITSLSYEASKKHKDEEL